MNPDFFKINIGQVLMAVGFVFGAGGVWFGVNFKLRALAERQAKMDTTIHEFESKGVLLVIGQHEARIQKLEGLQATLNTMETNIALIQQSLQISGKQKQLS